jgi:uncharacterized membrane protein YphA (DoxX/SURF4 family)
MRLTWVRDGAIVLGVGLVVAALGAECLAVFNACFADPACYPASGGLPFGEFFAILVVGIALSLIGGLQVVLGLRLEPKASAFEIPP